MVAETGVEVWALSRPPELPDHSQAPIGKIIQAGCWDFAKPGLGSAEGPRSIPGLSGGMWPSVRTWIVGAGELVREPVHFLGIKTGGRCREGGKRPVGGRARMRLPRRFKSHNRVNAFHDRNNGSPPVWHRWIERLQQAERAQGSILRGLDAWRVRECLVHFMTSEHERAESWAVELEQCVQDADRLIDRRQALRRRWY